MQVGAAEQMVVANVLVTHLYQHARKFVLSAQQHVWHMQTTLCCMREIRTAMNGGPMHGPADAMFPCIGGLFVLEDCLNSCREIVCSAHGRTHVSRASAH